MINGLAPGRRLGLGLACGLLWGAAVTAMETLSQPMQAVPLQDLLALVGSIAWTWALSGLWWALVALPLADLPARRLVALIPPLAVAITIIHRATWMIGLTFSLQGGSAELMGAAPQPAAIFFHVLWANLFYGGLYLLAFAGYRRVWRSQQLLAEFASSRAEVDAIQQEARLRALRGQLQPNILIEALEALQASYKSAPAYANALFDELVRFLRAAMPAIRQRWATLDSELALVRHYVELRRHIGIGGGVMVHEPDRPAVEVPFPPLCLLPLIEELTRDLSQDARLEIRRTGGPDWTGVRLDLACHLRSPGDEAGRQAERKLRIELAALYGAEAHFGLSRRAGRTSVQIRIPTAAREAHGGRGFPEEIVR